MAAVSSDNIREYEKMVSGMIKRMLPKYGRYIEADDMRSVCMISIWRSLSRGESEPRKLMTSMRSLVIDELRKNDFVSRYGLAKAKATGVPATMGFVTITVSSDGTPETHRAFTPPPHMEHHIDTRRFVSSLTRKQRYLVDRVLEGYTLEETGEALGVSSSRVCQLVGEIRKVHNSGQHSSVLRG